MQENYDDFQSSRGVTKKIILDHNGGVQGGAKTDHVIYEWPLMLNVDSQKYLLAI